MAYPIDNEKVVWPVGDADLLTPAYAATLAVTIANRKTILKPQILTGDCTLNITPSAQQRVGDTLVVVIKATANADDVTFGTSIEAPVLVGVAGKTKVQNFEYDGTNFIATGDFVQID